ncbi:hypothetical protein C8Q77DRAFT_1155821 [Trametes polyzona]|nr:hypothetical protein C8Q77DRAFT_1155821 [Trametes polyzona]
MATSMLQNISLGGTLGVTFLGVCVSSMLYGVTCLQTFNYYRSAKAKSDGHLMWLMVAALLIFDSGHQAIVIHAVYNYLVLSFANPIRVTQLVWSIPTEVVFNAILAIILNGFLTYRIWKVSRLYSLTVVATVLSLANFGTNLAYAIRGYFYTNIFAAERELRPHGIAGLSISVATECMISFSLAYYLHTRRTGLSKSNDIITKLILVSVTTGLLIAAFNIADLIAYVTAKDDLYILFFNFMLGKLYANSLLTSLNSREYVLGILSDGQPASNHETIKLSPTGGRYGQSTSRSGAGVGGMSSHQVHIAMDRFVVSDLDVDDPRKYQRCAVVGF